MCLAIFSLLLWRQYAQIFGPKHFPRMQNVWLMGVAQKRLCLSLLINNQPLGSLSQASLISSDLELPEMYNIKATEWQRQQKCHPKREFVLFQTSLLLFHCQMLGFFQELNSRGLYLISQHKKRKSLSSVYVLYKM